MQKNKPTLVILAAGMGSRYGGLKQMDVFTPEGDTIIDFSLFDALEAGFGKFVFIIRKNFETEFKLAFDKKLKNKAEVVYVFQEVENIPVKYSNQNRIKPWGTGHALLMAKEVVSENFAVINADDFYGKEAFIEMAKSLINTDKNSYDFKMMAYLLKNTVSDFGYVSRGECKVNGENHLTEITERIHIEKIDNLIQFKDEIGEISIIDKNTIVSMNFWGFSPKIFDYTSKLFEQFLEENHNDLKSEFYIPLIISEFITSNKATVEVLKSDAKWFGVTYKEDKEVVQKAIQELKRKNVYPKHLWN
ncbi:nucleotidyltransferase-like protein [Lutibacter sp. Hel_I_33_5]|uniref:sugar phosphate nucleotidyltransferase n=1 Tax=Lutibacter sp. Hel_I_33_5 TaxID=1566289 RepID=UPI0011A15EC5|nr:sugar phosphate nucleotidyltransferase [Lutibacter sp. Hel_I_33_5]TVZ55654.1 nucleotidyltransferase-like protein [Lutibacter sp. Hel_I_33_5]